LNTLGWYIIGLSLTSIITSIIKISYGELRPHFIAACNPNFTEINCNDNFGSPQYVSDAECQGSASVVMEAR
jgi:phosphatidate phosphatase